MANAMLKTLAKRLKTHPPFDRLDDSTMREVVLAMEVQYAGAGEIVFEEGHPPVDQVWLVHKGAVRLTRDGELVAICEAGDLFGVRAHLATRHYRATATVGDEALLYAWPADQFLSWTRQFPVIAVHLASGFAVEGPLGQLADVPDLLHQGTETVHPVRSLVTCRPTTTIRQAAQAMSERRVGSILVVDEQRRPLGIVTDVDLRTKVVARAVDVDATTVEDIMSAPVITVRDAPTLTEATVQMAQTGIHHLVTTEDGSPTRPATGMVTHHDVLMETGENPAALARALRRAQSNAELRSVRKRLDTIVERYVESNLPIEFVARVTAAVTDQMTRRAIELALKAAGPAPAPFAWLALGSQGRREQILSTDQDNALVYEEGPHQPYFLSLAKRVVESLHEAGFERCPGDMMASNARWCLDLAAWCRVFSQWMEVPEPKALMHANIFFDFRALAGETTLETRLRNHIGDSAQSVRRFLPMLANNALANPVPLSFFGSFVLERSGEHRQQFDIKARAMMPFADAARVLALEHVTPEVNTVARFAAVAKRTPNLTEVCLAAGRAYRCLMEIRTKQGLANQDGGRFVPINRLDTYDRQRLRQAFRSLVDLQRILNVRYQTDLIR